MLEAGSWLNSYRVTIPPNLVHSKQWPDHRLVISGLTRQQVMDTPGTEKHIRGGRRQPSGGGGRHVVGLLPDRHPAASLAGVQRSAPAEHAGGPGYHLRATDGYIGHLTDFIFDDETWKIRYLLVDTRNWWPGKHVLLAPSQVTAIEGEERLVRLNLTLEQIEHRRRYDAQAPLEEPQAAGPRGMMPPFPHGRHIV